MSKTAIGRSDLRGFHKDLVDVIITAIDLGWEARRQSSGSVRLRSYDGKVSRTIAMQHKSIAPGTIKSLMKMVIEHGEPERIAVAASGVERREGYTQELTEKMTDILVPQPPPVSAPEPVVQERESVPVGQYQEPHVVHEEPYLAKKSAGDRVRREGLRYVSQAVIKRKWSDGSIDYKCADCDFSAPTMRSVAAHRTKHPEKAKGWMGAPEVTDPSYIAEAEAERVRKASSRPYRPRRARIEALAAALREVLLDNDGKSVDVTKFAEQLAEEALVWMHVAGSTEPLETEPLTDAEVLDKIRSLVDRGQYVETQRELEALRTRVDGLVEDLAQKELAVATAEERANKLATTLSTFRELVDDVVSSQEESG